MQMQGPCSLPLWTHSLTTHLQGLNLSFFFSTPVPSFLFYALAACQKKKKKEEGFTAGRGCVQGGKGELNK